MVIKLSSIRTDREMSEIAGAAILTVRAGDAQFMRADLLLVILSLSVF
jgi:hypothetical protein